MPPQIIVAASFIVGVLVIGDSIVSYRARRLKARIQDRIALDASEQRAKNPESTHSVEAVNGGVFASFLANPVLRAVMIPIGGGGLLSLIEMLGG